MAGARTHAIAQWLSQYGLPGAAGWSQNTQGRSALVIQVQVGRLTLGARAAAGGGCFRVGIALPFPVTLREVRQPRCDRQPPSLNFSNAVGASGLRI
jgi:hypothetical protein